MFSNLVLPSDLFCTTKKSKGYLYTATKRDFRCSMLVSFMFCTQNIFNSSDQVAARLGGCTLDGDSNSGTHVLEISRPFLEFRLWMMVLN